MGVTLGGYRLLERLGEGDAGEVWKAKSTGVEGFERVVAVRRIRPALATDAAFLEAYVREVKRAARLCHGNVVQVLDVDEHNGEYFVAMEYVAGVDLATLLGQARSRGVAVPVSVAVFVAAEAARALYYAHGRRDEHGRPLGLVHRAVAPRNLLVSWDGEVKLADFGVARAWEAMGDAADPRTLAVDRAAYRSPEHLATGEVDARSDVFSLGTVLYEMLTGRAPFSAPTAFETWSRILSGRYAPPAELRADVGEVLGAIVSRMLAREPEGRYADAGRVHEHLIELLYDAAEPFGTAELATFVARVR